MTRNASFDDFLNLKEGAFRVFVFLLGDEYPSLNMENHWLFHNSLNVSIVRLNEDEFRMLDIARHPKIMVTNLGKELLQIDGIPDPETFEKKLKELI